MSARKGLSSFDVHAAFPDHDSAIVFLEKTRWPDGVTCAHCDSPNTTPIPSRKRHQCNACRKQFSVRTNSVFENTRIPLHKWLHAIYHLQNARKGMSSIQLGKQIGVSQQAAWFMLHRLREAMDVQALKLSGTIEVDETYIGGLEGNKHRGKRSGKRGRSRAKQPVIGLRERGGRAVAFPIPSVSRRVLHTAIRQNVEPDSTIYTDDFRSYDGLTYHRFEHDRVLHAKGEYGRGDVYTNSVESLWALIKRGYKGVYHYWHPKNTHRYVQEFVFRLNNVHPRRVTYEDLRAVVKHAIGKRLTYNDCQDFVQREGVNSSFPRRM